MIARVDGVSRAPLNPADWQPWIDHVCAAVEVDPAAVDMAAIHDLSGQVARDFTRPMAPVATHIWGLGGGTEQARDAVAAAAVDAGAAPADAES